MIMPSVQHYFLVLSNIIISLVGFVELVNYSTFLIAVQVTNFRVVKHLTITDVLFVCWGSFTHPFITDIPFTSLACFVPWGWRDPIEGSNLYPSGGWDRTRGTACLGSDSRKPGASSALLHHSMLCLESLWPLFGKKNPYSAPNGWDVNTRQLWVPHKSHKQQMFFLLTAKSWKPRTLKRVQ